MARDAAWYAKMRKLTKKMEKCLRKPFTPAMDEERLLLLFQIREHKEAGNGGTPYD